MAKLEEFSALDATALAEPFVPLSFLGSLSRLILDSLMLASGKGESFIMHFLQLTLMRRASI